MKPVSDFTIPAIHRNAVGGGLNVKDIVPLVGGATSFR